MKQNVAGNESCLNVMICVKAAYVKVTAVSSLREEFTGINKGMFTTL